MMMNATCKDRERNFEDGTPGGMGRYLEAQFCNCPVCAEELKAWKYSPLQRRRCVTTRTALLLAAHRTRSCRRSPCGNAESRAQELALLPAKHSFELANRVRAHSFWC